MLSDIESSDDLRNKFKSLIEETEREVIREETQSNSWIIEFKNGIYTLNAIHVFPHTSVQVVTYLTFEFTKNQLELFNGIYSEANQRFLFDYGLRIALTSPYTFYSIDYERTMDGKSISGIPTGFYVGIRLFPNDKTFSINLLEHSIQSVVSVASLVQTYIASSLQSGEASITYQPDKRPPPSVMYEGG